jgi:hypothetical protein
VAASEFSTDERIVAYRNFAAEAVGSAKSCGNEANAALFLNVARQWIKLAELLEARRTGAAGLHGVRSLPTGQEETIGSRGFQAFWGELSPCSHIVEIYEDDQKFLDHLAEFVAGGIVQDEAVIIIATPQHRLALTKRLAATGFDVSSITRADQLLLLDAEETISQFCIREWPDEELFSDVIGGVLERATKHGRKVRAFGEMVALLWAKGLCGATIRLEHLWTDFCRRQSFSLFCAYPKIGFTGNAAEDMARVCGVHSHVFQAA